MKNKNSKRKINVKLLEIMKVRKNNNKINKNITIIKKKIF